MACTDEERGKGKTPKDEISMRIDSWAYREEGYDCHLTDGALSNDQDFLSRPFVSTFFM